MLTLKTDPGVNLLISTVPPGTAPPHAAVAPHEATSDRAMIETTTVEGAISAPDTHVRIMMIAEEMAITGRVRRTRI